MLTTFDEIKIGLQQAVDYEKSNKEKMVKKITQPKQPREFGESHWVVNGGTMYCQHCFETTKARKWHIYIKCRFCPDCGFEMTEEEQTNE